MALPRRQSHLPERSRHHSDRGAKATTTDRSLAWSGHLRRGTLPAYDPDGSPHEGRRTAMTLEEQVSARLFQTAVDLEHVDHQALADDIRESAYSASVAAIPEDQWWALVVRHGGLGHTEAQRRGQG